MQRGAWRALAWHSFEAARRRGARTESSSSRNVEGRLSRARRARGSRAPRRVSCAPPVARQSGRARRRHSSASPGRRATGLPVEKVRDPFWSATRQACWRPTRLLSRLGCPSEPGGQMAPSSRSGRAMASDASRGAAPASNQLERRRANHDDVLHVLVKPRRREARASRRGEPLLEVQPTQEPPVEPQGLVDWV